MKLLAFEASSQISSVALLDAGRVLERRSRAGAGGAQSLLPMAEALLAECGEKLEAMDALAFGRGPGSFTGLRVCAAAVQGLAYGAQLPTLPLSSLAILAQGAIRAAGAGDGERLAPLLDARVGQVYCGLYEVADGIVRPLAEDRLCSPQQALDFLSQAGGAWRAAGGDWRVVPALRSSEPARDAAALFPAAADAAALAAQALRSGARTLPPEQALPLYLRGAGSWEKQQRSASAAG